MTDDPATSYVAVLDPLDPVMPCACGNCDWKGALAQLGPVGDCCLTPGDPSPAGRCPECEALSYPDPLAGRARTEPFALNFGVAHEAVQLLARVANGESGPASAERAAAIVARWAASLSTKAQREAVTLRYGLVLDDEGVCVSPGTVGFFVQSWSWVGYDEHPQLRPATSGKSFGSAASGNDEVEL